MRTIGTSTYGLICPIFKEGDDLCEIITNTLLNSGLEINDRDVLGITESVVARAEGNYVTVDEVADSVKKLFNNPKDILVYNPIYSRNRFAMILKGIARAVTGTVYIRMPYIDEVGNVLENHPFTGLNYNEYYKSIVESEGKKCHIIYQNESVGYFDNVIDCQIHQNTFDITLKDICSDKCEYGLYGSNKATEEKLKLFPSKKFAQELVENIQITIYGKVGKKIEVMVYGDGCFKDPVGGIWELADPVVSPAYTDGLNGTPNELKLKYLADNDYKDLSGDELTNAIKQSIRSKNKNLVGYMASQATTPRRLTDLLGSLMDLTSGSGDKGTPVIYVKGYFDNLSTY